MLVEQAFWGRLVNPFVTLVMLMVAVPFVLTVRREVGTGQRVVAGVVIGLGFHLFDKMFGHLGLVYEFNPLFSVSFPTILALAGVLVALWRMGSA
jgi:lipopolysaccharide export system permease protein